jgi:MoaA/NifB/PqqE/SkfB family radical SAM enzyme|tara:strand:+ start:496 stop:1422 length:927 start_codon:yes stop_codon:yes gene_type:complete
MCPRFDFELNLIKEITNNSHTTLDMIKDRIGGKILSQLKTFYSCGVLGDGAMNPQCVEIYDHVKTSGTFATSLSTNGGLRNKEFWKALAQTKTRVVFAIDGLKDTNHLYRRNVKFEKLIENVEAFIGAGGVADWDFLIFKHNQHQIDEAEQMSKKLGFRSFNKKETTRWDDFDSDGNWIQRKSIKIDDYSLEKVETETENNKGLSMTQKAKITDTFKTRKINCYSFHQGNSEIYIAANGDVSPCCWLGDLKIHEAKNIINDYKKINLNYTNLEDILNGHFFKELERGIQGHKEAYRLQTCYHTCGVAA